MNKKQWFKWHQWAGLNFSLLVCFVLVSGTLAVVSHEIDWLTNASIRVSPAVESEAVNWQRVYQTAKHHNPDDLIQSIRGPVSRWFAVKVIRVDQIGKPYIEYYHPETGQYQGHGRWYNWNRFFRMAHRHLMVPTIYGVSIVGIAGLLILFSMISGLFIYPKWWRGFFRKPRRKNSRMFWGDIHRLFGLWSSWLLIIVCLTGVWYLLEVWGLNAVYPKDNIVLSKPAVEQRIQPSVGTLKLALKQLPKYHENLEIKNIRFPFRKGQAIIVQGQSETLLVRDRANSVSFDPFNGHYLSRRIGKEHSLHIRISEAADPLHFGVFAGYYSKIVYFLFGILLSGVAISGTYVYGLRNTKQFKNTPQKAKKAWAYSWQNMGYWRWMCLAFISICFVIAILLFSNTISQN